MESLLKNLARGQRSIWTVVLARLQLKNVPRPCLASVINNPVILRSSRVFVGLTFRRARREPKYPTDPTQSELTEGSTFDLGVIAPTRGNGAASRREAYRWPTFRGSSFNGVLKSRREASLNAF